MNNPTPKELSECLLEKGLPRAQQVIREEIEKQASLSESRKRDAFRMFEAGYLACLHDLSTMVVES